MVSERTRALKERAYSKATSGPQYVNPIYVDMERSKLWTEAYRLTDGRPEVIRRATAFVNLLENMTIYIKENELIVGNISCDPYSVPSSFELSDLALQQCQEDGYIRPEDMATFNEMMDYWQDKSLWGRTKLEVAPEEYGQATGETFQSETLRDGEGTCAPDYPFVFAQGFENIIRQLEAKIRETEKINYGPEIKTAVERRTQWRAMKMTCEAAIKWAERFAWLARTVAARVDNPQQRAELLEVAATCEKCLRYPVKTLREAVQAMWFIQVLTHNLEQPCAGTSVRIDQIFNPYYEQDIRGGRITYDGALELLECLWVKFLEVGQPRTRLYREGYQGAPSVGPLVYTIGGVKRDGSDACNEVTKLCMEATKNLRSIVPSYALRYHAKISPAVIDTALEVIRTGMAIPSFESDAVNIPILMDFGCTLEQARDYANILCKSPGSVAPGLGTVRRHPWSLNVLGCLAVMLHNGIDILSGKRYGPPCDAEKFQSIDDLLAGYRDQIRYTVELGVKLRTIGRVMEAKYMPRPFLSSCYEPYIERGEDCAGLDIISWPWINVMGMVDAGDSITAIRKLIFEEKKYTMGQLLEALRNDWEGYEVMRQDCLNAPKWGNDDDYADWSVKVVYDMLVEEMARVKDYSGAPYKPLPQSITLFRRMGRLTAASPDGRKAREIQTDGGVSPRYGCDKKGPTAVLRSCAKLDHSKGKGNLLNQRFSPASLQGEKGRQLFHAYLKTWYDLGAQHVQLNVVDSAELKAAQKEPNKYPDLVVRVAGYSAYFNELEKVTQDSIIARTEQQLA